MAEQIVLWISIICTLYVGVGTLITGKMYGEASPVPLSVEKIDVFILLLMTLLLYVIMWIFYKKTQNNMFSFAGIPKMSFKKNRIHKLVALFLLVKIVGTMFWGIGRVGTTSTYSFSLLFSIIKIEEFFPIYYVIGRDTKKKLYWLNIGLYTLLQLLQSWTGFIFTFAFIELFLWVKKNSLLKKSIKLLQPTVLAVVATFVGGAVYSLAWPIKQAVRYGGNVGTYILSINEGVIKLVERISHFPMIVLAWQNGEKIADLYKLQNSSEILCIFRPLLPAIVMPGKDSLRSLSNLIIQSMFRDIGNITGANYGIIMYMYTLIKSNIMDGILYFILLFLLFLLCCSILKAFDNTEHDIKILYFFFLKGIVEGGSLEGFSYGYLGAIYMIIILWICGGINIYYRRGGRCL